MATDFFQQWSKNTAKQTLTLQWIRQEKKEKDGRGRSRSFVPHPEKDQPTSSQYASLSSPGQRKIQNFLTMKRDRVVAGGNFSSRQTATDAYRNKSRGGYRYTTGRREVTPRGFRKVRVRTVSVLYGIFSYRTHLVPAPPPLPVPLLATVDYHLQPTDKSGADASNTSSVTYSPERSQSHVTYLPQRSQSHVRNRRQTGAEEENPGKVDPLMMWVRSSVDVMTLKSPSDPRQAGGDQGRDNENKDIPQHSILPLHSPHLQHSHTRLLQSQSSPSCCHSDAPRLKTGQEDADSSFALSPGSATVPDMSLMKRRNQGEFASELTPVASPDMVDLEWLQSPAYTNLQNPKQDPEHTGTPTCQIRADGVPHKTQVPRNVSNSQLLTNDTDQSPLGDESVEDSSSQMLFTSLLQDKEYLKAGRSAQDEGRPVDPGPDFSEASQHRAKRRSACSRKSRMQKLRLLYLGCTLCVGRAACFSASELRTDMGHMSPLSKSEETTITEHAINFKKRTSSPPSSLSKELPRSLDIEPLGNMQEVQNESNVDKQPHGDMQEVQHEKDANFLQSNFPETSASRNPEILSSVVVKDTANRSMRTGSRSGHVLKKPAPNSLNKSSHFETDSPVSTTLKTTETPKQSRSEPTLRTKATLSLTHVSEWQQHRTQYRHSVTQTVTTFPSSTHERSSTENDERATTNDYEEITGDDNTKPYTTTTSDTEHVQPNLVATKEKSSMSLPTTLLINTTFDSRPTLPVISCENIPACHNGSETNKKTAQESWQEISCLQKSGTVDHSPLCPMLIQQDSSFPLLPCEEENALSQMNAPFFPVLTLSDISLQHHYHHHTMGSGDDLTPSVSDVSSSDVSGDSIDLELWRENVRAATSFRKRNMQQGRGKRGQKRRTKATAPAGIQITDFENVRKISDVLRSLALCCLPSRLADKGGTG